MLILAFESTAKVASIAAAENDKILASYTVDNGLTQSELLLPMAEEALRALHKTFDDVELYACSVGPGSFTGVRIGAALVKGLAFDRQIPCAAVSTLEALAQNAAGLSGWIVPVMDARRDQVYTALFASEGDVLKRIENDAALSLDELAESLSKRGDKPIYLVGDGYAVAKEGLARRGIATADTPMLLRDENAASVAAVAYRLFREGKCVDDRDLSPIYLRVPQAERERLEREKADKNASFDH